MRCDLCAGNETGGMGAWPCERQRAAEGGICLFVRFFTTRRCAVRCGQGGPLPVTGQASLSVFYALNFIKKDIFLYRLDSEQPVLFSIFFYDLQNSVYKKVIEGCFLSRFLFVAIRKPESLVEFV